MSTGGSLQWQASTHCSASCRLQATCTSQPPSYLCRLWQRQRSARRNAFKVGSLPGYQASRCACLLPVLGSVTTDNYELADKCAAHRPGKSCCAAKQQDPAGTHYCTICWPQFGLNNLNGHSGLQTLLRSMLTAAMQTAR